MFDQNMTIVTDAEFQADGGGFASRQTGSIPCDTGDIPMRTKFKVIPIRLWEFVREFEVEQVDQSFNVTWREVPNVDAYFVSIKVQRLQTKHAPGGDMNYPITYAYHGGRTSGTQLNIPLPFYNYSNDLNSGAYGSLIDVRIVAYKNCNEGGPAFGYGGDVVKQVEA
jgi:hypothetical protein